ncbi:MAG: hypothetical protein Fur0025_06030 [Oscillatoriaceae cyanobacterium]
MNEQPIAAYLSLIQKLLTRPGEANQILNQSIELVDEVRGKKPGPASKGLNKPGPARSISV